METHYEQGSDAWKQARYSCVTCTDLGKILGLDTGCTRQKLLASKRKKVEVMDKCTPFVQSLLDNGRRFEETCRESWKSWYVSQKKAGQGFVPSMHVDPELPFFSGSPDYVVPGDKLLVECKTHFYPNITDAWPVQRVEDIRLKHYVQIQGYLRIMGYDLGYLISWTLCHGFCIYVIQFDEALWNQILRPNIERFKSMMDRARDSYVPEARMGRGESDANSVCVYTSMLGHSARVA